MGEIQFLSKSGSPAHLQLRMETSAFAACLPFPAEHELSPWERGDTVTQAHGLGKGLVFLRLESCDSRGSEV